MTCPPNSVPLKMLVFQVLGLGCERGSGLRGLARLIVVTIAAVVVTTLWIAFQDQVLQVPIPVAAPTPQPTPSPTPVSETGPIPSKIDGVPKSIELISVNYSWDYRGKWSWEGKLPVSLYDYYRELPRPPTNNYSVYVTHPVDDPYIDMLVEKITNAAQTKGFTVAQTVEFAAAFVQSLPYTVDSVTTPYDEYPRYPLETLKDNGGDCEDTSILLASIVDKMGYGTVLIRFPTHIGVGVKGGENIPGDYWEYEGNKYYYIETTGENWGIGKLPEEYKNTPAFIHPMIPVPILTHDGSIKRRGIITDVEVKVSNLGTAQANKVTVSAGFDAGSGMVWNSQKSEPFILGASQQAVVKLNLRIPLDKHTRLIVQISIDGVLVEEGFTGWFDT